MFVSGDVIHQVPLLIIVFIAVFCVFQKVKSLQNITWTPGYKHQCCYT